MAGLSMAFLALVLVDVAGTAEGPYRTWLDRASLSIWAIFVAEFAMKLALAPDRPTYLRRRWFDVLVLALPMLRVLRAMRAQIRSLRDALW